MTRFAAFADVVMEGAYRAHHADADRRTARVCALVTMAGLVVFVPSDYRLFGTGREFYLLSATRAVAAAVCALTWFGLRRPLPAPVRDRVLFAWGAVVVAQILYITSTRPPTYVGHAVVNLNAVMLAYAVIPHPLVLQVALAGSLSLGCALLAAGDGLEARAVGWAFLGANTLGVVVSRRLHRQGREMFAARLRQEQALAEVRTLRGLIRVCAWCRKVDAGGGWQQFEAYVRDHSHAEFTHGICPVCMATVSAETPAAD